MTLDCLYNTRVGGYISSGIPKNDAVVLFSQPRQIPLVEQQIFDPPVGTLVTDSGKLLMLDRMLPLLKKRGHRVLMYSQMTRMIDILEQYLSLRGHRYIRLDGQSKLEDRRDMVEDWQTKPEIFCFLLSTRAGGLGINLTAADTVIFYDSDWNPTMDEQAMDRAHRLGQKKNVSGSSCLFSHCSVPPGHSQLSRGEDSETRQDETLHPIHCHSRRRS